MIFGKKLRSFLLELLKAFVFIYSRKFAATNPGDPNIKWLTTSKLSFAKIA